MTRIYKTAKGKTIDMDKVKLANETATAVGNMKVNARGDLLGAGGQITAGRNEIMDRVYAVASAPDEGYSPNDPGIVSQKQEAETRSQALHNLANGLIEATTAEPIVDDTKPVDATVAPARGSLASSIAKKAVVTQTPTPDPRKPKGPSRI
jgi:Flp pilus assembly protein TadG